MNSSMNIILEAMPKFGRLSRGPLYMNTNRASWNKPVRFQVRSKWVFVFLYFIWGLYTHARPEVENKKARCDL